MNRQMKIIVLHTKPNIIDTIYVSKITVTRFKHFYLALKYEPTFREVMPRIDYFQAFQDETNNKILD
ncbi:CLUMA_CG018436, isoform A [Clunio marinus]|uniref:CLUMA_CG018436, isoform A n=1 Tax=Clunio marinus TaxID=568069 RepID=A0A1J1IY75_9DIPT|nr:CLUMA_CG018436, isoform A [Clunio marinus]